MQGLRHSFGGRNSARLQRDYNCIGIEKFVVCWDIDCKHHPHSCAHQIIAEIRGSGKVISNAAENWLVHFFRNPYI
jgi:hypothetical protein